MRNRLPGIVLTAGFLAAQEGVTVENLKAALGPVLREYVPASGRISLRYEFDAADELKLLDRRLLDRTGGTARVESGSLVIAGKDAKGDSVFPHVHVQPVEVMFEKQLTVRLWIDELRTDGAMPELYLMSNEDGVNGYRLVLASGISGRADLTAVNRSGVRSPLAAKGAEIPHGDKLEIVASCTSQRIAINIKGAKTRPIALEGKATTGDSGRFGIGLRLEGKATFRIAKLELEGLASAASLKRMLDVLTLRGRDEDVAADKDKGGDAGKDKGEPRSVEEQMRKLFADRYLSLPGHRIDFRAILSLPESAMEKFFEALMTRDAEQRIAALEKFVESVPDRVAPRLFMALAYEDLGEFRKARAHLEKALELDGRALNARLMLAFHAYLDRDAQGLREQADKALELASENPTALALRARSRLGANDRAGAKTDAEMAVALAGEPDAWGKTEAERVAAVCRGPSWVRGPFEVKTDHYVVQSEVSPEWSAALGKRLEQSYALFNKYFRPAPAGHEPGRVLVFSSKEAYQRYAQASMGSDLEFTLGVFVPWSREFLMFCREEKAESLETLVHEGFHQYLNHFVPKAPHWFNEGMAQYFESTDFSAGETGIGKPVRMRVDTLRGNYTAEPLPELMQMTPSRFMYPRRAGNHYAQSWALCHFLMRAPGPWKETFQTYTNQVLAGASLADAYAKSFGQMPADKHKAMTDAFQRHVDKLKQGK